MVYLWLIILIASFLLLAHSYIIFPAWMGRLSRKYKQKMPANSSFEPSVAVLIAAYNEADKIASKIESTLQTHYPSDKLSIFIGSDASSDNTDEIVQSYAQVHPNIFFYRFGERSGKPHIINMLYEKTQEEILVLTDADTLFEPSTIPALTRYFQEPQIGGVQANVMTEGNQEENVAFQEINYNQREFRMKRGESVKGAVIGAFGACYAIRQEAYKKVPTSFYVDDFYIFMNILSLGYKTVFADDAICHMKVSGSSEVQFRRKIRIGKGNFQNLLQFLPMANPFQNFASFAFFSHKVIRWCGPFLMLLMVLTNGLLWSHHVLFQGLMIGQVLFYCLGLVDLLLRKFSWQITPIRFISHFLMMNLALLIGFWKFLYTSGDGKWENLPD